MRSRYWRKTTYRDATCYYCISPACREAIFTDCHAFVLRDTIYIQFKSILSNVDLMEHEYHNVLQWRRYGHAGEVLYKLFSPLSVLNPFEVSAYAAGLRGIKKAASEGRLWHTAGPIGVNGEFMRPTQCRQTNGLPSSNGSKRPEPVEIDLSMPAATRWFAFGKTYGEQVAQLLDDADAELLGDSGLMEALPVWQRQLIRRTSSSGGAWVGRIARWLGGEYAAELQGLARGAGLPYGKLIAGNLIYDLGQITERWRFGRRPVGCSSYSCNIGGRPVLARTMDWVLPSTIGRYTMVFRFVGQEHPYMALGFAGFVGVLSAISKAGWAVTLNQAPCEQLPYQVTQMPATMRLREACDAAGSYAELANDLESYQSMTPFFAHVVGSKPSQHCVIEHCGREVGRRNWQSQPMIQTNHFCGEDDGHLNPPAVWEEGQVEYYCCSYPRFDALERRLQKAPRTLSGAMDKLRAQPVTTGDTQHTMVLSPASGTMLLRIRPGQGTRLGPRLRFRA